MAGRFPGADLVVFGHSHIPLDSGRGHGSRSQSPRLAERKPGLRLAKPKPGGGPRIFNPGSPTDRRSQPVGTMGLLEIVEGRLRSARIVPVT
jgi:predicted phosphodiesterase